MRFSPLLLLSFCLTLSAGAQQIPQANPNSEAAAKPGAPSLNPADSLKVKRTIFITSIYKGKTRLPSKSLESLFSKDALASRQYHKGRILQPIGPLVSASGIVLSFIAIKGKPATEEVVYRNDYFTVHYTERSRPQLIGGLMLFTGGVVMVELSNDLIARAARQYNARFRNQQSTAPSVSFHLGVTPSSGVGLIGRF